MFLFATVVLTMVSVANADLILTLNGLDAAKEPIEIKVKTNLVIVVAGKTQVSANDCAIAAYGGTLEVHTGGYLFTFENELSVGAVSLITNKNMIIDGISVLAGGTIYELILFYIPETDTVIVFGFDLEALAPQPKPELELQLQPKELTEPKQQVSESQMSGFETFSVGDCNDILDPNWYPNLDNDQFINFKDFAILAANWQQSGSGLDGDINGSKMVDFNDLAVLTYFWLANTCGPSPEQVFESFKTALLADDVNEAVSYFAEVSAENYRLLLEQLRPYFTQMVNDMGELVFIKFDTDMVMYDLLREEDGRTYGYPVVFVRDEMGQWKIYDF